MTERLSVQAVDAVAARLCPSHHREGYAWSLRNNEGLVSVGTSVLSPCAVHMGAARVAVATLLGLGWQPAAPMPDSPPTCPVHGEPLSGGDQCRRCFGEIGES